MGTGRHLRRAGQWVGRGLVALSAALCVPAAVGCVRGYRTSDVFQCTWVQRAQRVPYHGPNSMSAWFEGRRFTLTVDRGRVTAESHATGGGTYDRTGVRWDWWTIPPVGRRGPWFAAESEWHDSDALGRQWGPTLTVPCGVAFAAFAVAPAAWTVAAVRRRRRPPHACRGCGYDLRASPGRCPECGRVASA